MLASRWFSFTHAIVRRIPTSLRNEAQRMNDGPEVDIAKARREWDHYVNTLGSCGVEVIRLEADESFPDCTFVEDPVIVIGQKALLTRLGHTTRLGEVSTMRSALKEHFSLELTEMTDDGATMDGGDVLFTGREILVGKSSRTNDKGIACLAQTFPEFPVTTIPVQGTLHLKSVTTLGCEDLLLFGGSDAAREVLKEVKQRAKHEYKIVELGCDTAANVVMVNGHVLHKTEAEIGSEAYKKLKTNLTGMKLHEVTSEELYKVDGCLTCCSVLINNSHK